MGTIETSSTIVVEVEPTGSPTVVDGSILAATTTVQRTSVDCSRTKMAEESAVTVADSMSTSTTSSHMAASALGTAVAVSNSSRCPLVAVTVENNRSLELGAVAPWPEYNEENQLLPLISSRILLAIDQIY